MDGTRPHPLSLRQRLRQVTTLACALMALLGLWSLLSARPAHGVLALAASLLLVQGSVWGRKARRAPMHRP
ncbi:MAG: hypothetical protein A3G29_12110 [Burkholderiales bacterium RIFCSPLOWO2_12_FULL_64_99]|jgi:hypothetical protein|nr:MAG: hypothetical protein A3E52_05605 [Burkholderiales bacterium RIFCSPHIGHO2_12_FULL_63_20]OGB61641.1 MAG: hypothetical protein A3G29_12110 [Burkholderiales bacterium RIFCSPLOWO2_12_FULL_64_99]